MSKLEKALSLVYEGRIVELAKELVGVPSVSGATGARRQVVLGAFYPAP